MVYLYKLYEGVVSFESSIHNTVETPNWLRVCLDFTFLIDILPLNQYKSYKYIWVYILKDIVQTKVEI